MDVLSSFSNDITVALSASGSLASDVFKPFTPSATDGINFDLDLARIQSLWLAERRFGRAKHWILFEGEQYANTNENLYKFVIRSVDQSELEGERIQLQSSCPSI